MKTENNINLGKVIKLNLIKSHTEAADKKDIITQLTDLLYREKCISEKESFINDVFLREEEGSTGLSQGIAIPHGKSKSVKKTSIAIATLKNQIFWEEPDEHVEVVILFAVQDKDVETTHILLLQQVAIMLADEEFIDSIKKSKTKNEIYSLFVNRKNFKED
ncbi:PTS mannose transporter subunit IIAB [Leptotrichia sp. OH3620_COT-345]|uniref:PTS sugar transporter subunit IIA n=1 Tax=Leptotrichia sp. OH3620_COT-345 TaxID=2491048 RepID=UPI000F651C6E|nr:fructose PTS transporter subunit IIA [Leptotrichia sp. OH3620_COT-345]RRD40233.1 PTS mannose transporter subunit IIAB [Leptotrichia sp. OH3620_COT-345]